ncbi:DUF6922 domain-containing protein [Phytoactinopolyspora endophytica]|uniref:DUF6922 domain-containing protein n=1 Tax=Phytoactinopolyspora endophytica TaxID=1642495 RepID=UPI00101DF92E|nr:hypothetical protein [Phytoactinopolyspora endophytica]
MRLKKMDVEQMPERFAYLFWNADLSSLDLERDARYIASRLLMADDVAAWGWAVQHLPADALASVAKLRHASPRRAALARNLAAAAGVS